MKEKSKQNGNYGIPVNRFAFTILVLIAILHVIIILLIVDVNRSSTQLSELMQRSGDYQIDATKILESNTVFSETSANYIQLPVAPNGSANVGALKAYAEQIDEGDSASKVLERFRTYDVSPKVLSCIEDAANYSEQMFDIQIHAISLMRSVYPVPDIPEIASIPEFPLTEQELDTPPQGRVTAAKQMILNKSYASLRHKVASSIDECTLTLREEFDKASAAAQKRVATVRLLLWLSVFIIILVLSITFLMFYKLIVKPVRRYSDEIGKNKSIDQIRTIAELHRLVDAHNNLWNSRNKLESILREAATTDSLTGLPNRYCMEQDLMEIETHIRPVGVLLFDVNFLKQTNDTQGHLAGDTLICKAADCIKQCFSTEASNFCYRIGGDEFVAIMTDCPEAEIKERIEKFKAALDKENINVSFGYAYDENASADSFKALMAKADKEMYGQKQLVHKEYAK